MPKEKFKHTTRGVDNNVLLFESKESEDGTYADSMVTINGTFFCWIHDAKIEDFVKDFSEFIGKYRL